jgi:hypothetical protein
MSIAAESLHQNTSTTGGLSFTISWHKSAPRAIREASRAGRESAVWKAWRRHLDAKKCTIQDTLPWSGENVGPASAAKESLEMWLRDAAGGKFTYDDALSVLAWCRRLPGLADTLPADDWWTLLNHLILVATEAGAISAVEGCSGGDVLVRQLLAGELSLTLACLFPEIKQCRKLLPVGRRVLSGGLADLLDGVGLLHANYFDQLQPLLACWTRCRELGDRLKRGCWNSKAESQYRELVRNALRLSRRDGSMVFSEPSTDLAGIELLAAAVELVGKKKDRMLAAQLLNKGKEKLPSRRAELPEASVHSEWAAAAQMRPDWSRSSPRLTVLYPNTSCRIELNNGKDVLGSGEWVLDLKIDGQPAVPTSEWSEICWVSDKDVDYLELEIALGEGLRVQRHFLLARKDRILLLADAVLASRPAKLEYRGTLPLCAGVTFHEACETRQGVIGGPQSHTMVLPLAFPERLPSRADGRLSSTGRMLELQQSAEGQSLFAPMFFDLDQHRQNKPVTWRQLTVAEIWAKQPNDVAVGYRVAIGRRQWLVYRSLARLGNRSLLGHNISSEMLVARFHRDGEVEALIEIE